MSAPSQNLHRLALLLSGLGPEISEVAISGLDEKKASTIRVEMEKLATNPADSRELDDVLDEFDVFMRFALETAGAPTSWADEYFAEEDLNTEGIDSAATTKVKSSKLKLFQPTDDPINDLKMLEPVQISTALAGEHTKTIALMLSCLDNEKAADVINLFPEETQSQVFLTLQQKPVVPEELLIRIASKTVERAALVEPTKPETKDDDQQIVDLLRAMPKQTRNRLMSELETADPETANRLQDLLYIFSDVSQYDNRSIQKILGQCDTQVLVVALQGIDSAIGDRVFENLSKRASAALQEEMEFRQSSSDEEINVARDEIAKLIAQLDRSGELTELP